MRFSLVPTLLALCLSTSSTGNAQDDADLTARAGRILRTYCQRCHEGEGSESGYAFNVAHVQSLIDGSVVTAKDAESSELYTFMYRNRMPPRNRPQLPRPSAEEVGVIEKWIAAGAKEFPKPIQRDPIPLKTSLTQIHRHVSDASRDKIGNLRYFSLAQLFNDPTVDVETLKTVRAALSKALNSLSWEAKIVVPQAVDTEQTIFAIYISDLGWTREHWNALVAKYPCAVGYESQDDTDLAELDGNEQIVTGVSCIACHRSGMIEAPDDEVRKFSSVLAEAKQHVGRLYPENADIKSIIENNRSVFIPANDAATKKFLAFTAFKGKRRISL